MHISEVHVNDISHNSVACFYLVGAMEVFTKNFSQTLELSKASYCPEEWGRYVSLLRRQGYPVRLIVEQEDQSDQCKGESPHAHFLLKNRTRFYIFDDQAQDLQGVFQRNAEVCAARDLIDTLLVMLQTWRDRIARDIDLTVDQLAQKTYQSFLPFNWKQHTAFDSSYPYPIEKNEQRFQLTVREYQDAFESLKNSFQCGDGALLKQARSLYLKVFLYLTASPEFWDQTHHIETVDLLETAALKVEDFRHRKLLQYFSHSLQKFTPQSYPLFAIYPEDVLQQSQTMIS